MPSVTINVSQDKFEGFKSFLLHRYPVPTDINGEPQVNENEWLLTAIKTYFIEGEYRYRSQLARQAAEAAAEVDENLLDVSS